jgi:diguanylate cyclase (GGDEF)-like protein
MNTIAIDYSYLLRNLIPQNRLPHDLRREIKKALESSEPASLRLCAIRTLAKLERDSYFARTETIFLNDHISVCYNKVGGIYRLHLTFPRNEWNQLTGESGAAQEVPAGDAGDGGYVSIPAAGGITIEILPDVLRSLSINDRHDSMVRRLDALMERIPHWLRFREAAILITHESLEDVTRLAGAVYGAGEDALINSAAYGQIRSREDFMLVGPDSDRYQGLIGNFTTDQSLAIVPILTKEEFRGVLHLQLRESDQDNSLRSRIDIARRIVEQVIAINDQIENITSIDALTGIYNRHFYETQLPIEIERATRTGNKLSMLLIDIDDFKMINDTLGHKKGDQALSAVAGLIKNNLRKIDLPFRYGGEEFVILLPGTSEIEAVHTAERLRSVIDAYTGFEDEQGDPRQITVSVGVAVFPDHARTEEELFVKADAAMFRAKHRGKNRVELVGD